MKGEDTTMIRTDKMKKGWSLGNLQIKQTETREGKSWNDMMSSGVGAGAVGHVKVWERWMTVQVEKRKKGY